MPQDEVRFQQQRWKSEGGLEKKRLPRTTSLELRAKSVTLSNKVFKPEVIAQKVSEPIISLRSAEDRRANPERLNLDRMKLRKMPMLRNETCLKLLNLQNNQINQMQNLENVPRLVFLDFYNNALESLDQDQLKYIQDLRVLMLGKNLLTSIGPEIHYLKYLDVLDLHSNALTSVEYISDLKVLRVLNLAQNKISTLDHGLQRLDSLTELNLRRNQIKSIALDLKFPKLQRLFLSHNRLHSLREFTAFWDLPLTEITLEDNPLQEENYRGLMITRIKTLRHLDLSRITPTERRDLSFSSSEDNKEHFLFNETQRKWHTQSSDTSFGYFELEDKALALYGPKHIHEISPHLTSLSIRFVHLPLFIDKVRRLKRLKQANFSENNLADFPQLFSLLNALPHTIQHLNISLNPVCNLALFQTAVFALFPFLSTFNDAEVSTLEIHQAKQKFALLAPFVKASIQNKSKSKPSTDPGISSPTSTTTHTLFNTALSNALQKFTKRSHYLNVLYPAALNYLVSQSLHDFKSLNAAANANSNASSSSSSSDRSSGLHASSRTARKQEGKGDHELEKHQAPVSPTSSYQDDQFLSSFAVWHA